jgi:hypothetical protein
VINGDTTGTIWRDKDFLTSTQYSEKTCDFEVYPTFLSNHDILTIKTSEKINDLHLYSINGSEIPIDYLNNSQIAVEKLKSGVYILVLNIDDIMLSRKIIKL